MPYFKEFEITEIFDRAGFEVFDGVLDGDYCAKLANELSGSMARNCIGVNNDGVFINTKNGKHLISEFPQIKLFYDLIYSKILRFDKNLLVVEDLPVAISANLLRPEDGHVFRYHFDRNEYTAVLYLTENHDFPLQIYPNIRTDPVEGDSVWLYQQESVKPVSITPRQGRLVVFRGRTCLHGIVGNTKRLPGEERISLQFAYDTRFVSFKAQSYYGRIKVADI